MAQNRLLVTTARMEAIDVPIVGQCRIWKKGVNEGDPPEPTDLWLVYLETPDDWTIDSLPGARHLPSSEVNECDNRIKEIFQRSGVNLLDYGPAVRRSFRADIIVGRAMAIRLGA